jgi:hypothetical protein
MLRLLTIICIVLTLSACASDRLNRAYDAKQTEIDQKALRGEITWVQAAMYMRNLDKNLAQRSTFSWKYDKDDEEYHSYCLALAERLDKKQISFSEYNAARIQRFNAIRARSEALMNSAPRQTNCTTTNVGTRAFPEYKTTCN